MHALDANGNGLIICRSGNFAYLISLFHAFRSVVGAVAAENHRRSLHQQQAAETEMAARRVGAGGGGGGSAGGMGGLPLPRSASFQSLDGSATGTMVSALSGAGGGDALGSASARLRDLSRFSQVLT